MCVILIIITCYHPEAVPLKRSKSLGTYMYYISAWGTMGAAQRQLPQEHTTRVDTDVNDGQPRSPTR